MASACARLVRLARGVGELVLIVGDKLRNRLRLLALQLLERRVGLDQLALVGGELGLRLLEPLLRVVEVDLGADVEVDRLLPSEDALVQRVHQCVLERDAHVETLSRRELLRHLLVERLEGVGELGEIGAQDRLFAKPERLRARSRPTRSSGRSDPRAPRSDSGRCASRRASSCAPDALSGSAADRLASSSSHRLDGVAPAGDLGEARVQSVRSAPDVGVGVGRVELEQKVAALDRLPGLDMNRRNLSGIERLDHLGIAWRLDLAWRDGVDVEPTEVRPGQCGEGEGAD